MQRPYGQAAAGRAIGRAAVVLGLGLALAAPAPAGEWLAGDLHVHTTYSHDSWSPILLAMTSAMYLDGGE